MLPKHLSLPVNVQRLAMESDFVKIAPSYSTNLLPACLRVTSSSFTDKTECQFPSAQYSWYGWGKGSCILLCFKYQQLSSDWRTSCQFWRQRRIVWLWVLRWRCWETEKNQVFGWWPGNLRWKSKFLQCSSRKSSQSICSKTIMAAAVVQSVGNYLHGFTQFWSAYIQNISYLCKCLGTGCLTSISVF